MESIESENREGEQNGERMRLVSLAVEGTHYPVEESSLLRKLHYYILPYCVAAVLLAYMDRGNLGFAANQFCHDLKLTHTEYGIGASLFFVGYVLFHPSSIFAVRKLGVPRWLAIILFCWGIFASSLAFIQNVNQFYTLRFFLGVAEAGTFPTVWYYITLFYPDRFLVIPYAVLEVAVAMSSPVSAPTAAAFMSMDGLAGFKGWRLLFFFEGLIPICLSPFVFFCMARTPSTARFVQPEEAKWIEEQNEDVKKPLGGIMAELRTVMTCRGYWILTLTGVFRSILQTVILYWTTLIIHNMLVSNEEQEENEETCASSDSTGVKAIALTAVPYTIACVFTVAVAKWSKDFNDRRVITAVITASSGVFLVLYSFTWKLGLVFGLFCLSMATTGVSAPLPLLLGMIVSHFDSITKPMAITIFNMVSATGGFIGPILVGRLVDRYDNDYTIPLLVLGCIGVLGSLLILAVTDPLATKPNGIRQQD
eukprot:g2930.t1